MKKGVISVLSFIAGGVVSGSAIGSTLNKTINKEHELSQKHLKLMMVLNQWLALKQDGKDLVKFFEDNNYNSIAIYGMSYLGIRLVEELRNSGINIKYAIDKNPNVYSEYDLYNMDDELPEVDAVIVTPVFFFDEIEEALCEKIDCPIISLEDVVNYL